jgi:CheY-like chemotaxis protein
MFNRELSGLCQAPTNKFFCNEASNNNPFDANQDMQMPVMDGLAATRAICALPGGAAMPSLAMTANAFEEDRAQYLAAGMNYFVIKPVNVSALCASLLKWLEPAAD